MERGRVPFGRCPPANGRCTHARFRCSAITLLIEILLATLEGITTPWRRRETPRDWVRTEGYLDERRALSVEKDQTRKKQRASSKERKDIKERGRLEQIDRANLFLSGHT